MSSVRKLEQMLKVAKDCRSVHLASGKVLEVDIIIGVNGSYGIYCATLLSQDPQSP